MFTPGATVWTGAEDPQYMSAADIDGDGDLDLVTSDRGSDTVSVLVNNGSGVFVLADVLHVGGDPRQLALEDFNGDCRTDIAVTSNELRRVDVLYNLGTITFSQPISIAIMGEERPVGLTAADLDADGDVDLAATIHDGGVGLVVVMQNTGHGAFTSATFPSGTVDPDAIIAGDFNADGDKDLAVVGAGAATVSILPNLRGMNFGAASTFPVGANPGALARADLDGNGSLELIVVNRDENTVAVLTNVNMGGTDNFCVTTPNSAGFGTRIDSTGSLSLMNGFTLLVRCAPGQTPGLFFEGTGQANLPLGTGRLCVGGSVVRVAVVTTNTTGHASAQVHPATHGVTGGSTRYYQFWHRDATSTAELSDGLKATFTP